MILILVQLIAIIGNLITLLIIVDSVLSFVLPPYHPIRETTGRVLYPLYAPIRRVIPPIGAFDFTPLIVIILVQVVVNILTAFLRTL